MQACFKEAEVASLRLCTGSGYKSLHRPLFANFLRGRMNRMLAFVAPAGVFMAEGRPPPFQQLCSFNHNIAVPPLPQVRAKLSLEENLTPPGGVRLGVSDLLF